MLTPGLIDIHIHGAAGEDLISGKAEAAEAVSRNIAMDGCTAFMASLTVVSHERLLKFCAAWRRWRICQGRDAGHSFGRPRI